MTKAVSNREICFIKAVLLLCEHGHFSLNFALLGVLCLHPPSLHIIRVKKGQWKVFSNIAYPFVRCKDFQVFVKAQSSDHLYVYTVDIAPRMDFSLSKDE